ncbi:hypothetical protein [Streptomyces orinoci]|uniref:DUF4198 domain-containing protein n=1 Tax=Streptomyces orinoci TaxID=67339 RepID=A0ABV3K7W4_STRON|nr:hypothetical protein [Streptomyces orinoci]
MHRPARLPAFAAAVASALFLSVAPAHAETPSPSTSASPTAPVRPRLEVFGLGPHGHTPVRAGGIAAVHLSGMPPGWDKAKIRARPADPNDQLSYLFPNVVEVTPRDDRATESGDEYGHYTTGYPGRYVVTAYYHEREIASTEVTVNKAPYSGYVHRFDVYPRYSDPIDPVVQAHRVRPGAQAAVSMAVDKDEPGTLQAKSPAFEHPLVLRMHTDDDPGLRQDEENGPYVYAGHVQLRRDLPEGVYPVTVSSHRGRQSVTQNLIVSSKAEVPSSPPPSSSASTAPNSRPSPWLWAVIAVASVGLVTIVTLTVRDRRRRNSTAA